MRKGRSLLLLLKREPGPAYPALMIQKESGNRNQGLLVLINRQRDIGTAVHLFRAQLKGFDRDALDLQVNGAAECIFQLILEILQNGRI
jgi:hypothetical protein